MCAGGLKKALGPDRFIVFQRHVGILGLKNGILAGEL